MESLSKCTSLGRDRNIKKIWDKKEGESELDYKRRMEMIYKKSQQVYEGIITEGIAELIERIAQLEREFDR